MTALILDGGHGSGMTTNMLSANGRPHWTKERKVSQFWRLMARSAVNYARRDGEALRHQRAHVTITIRWPDRRQRDVHNYLRHIGKPIIDGLIDAGVLPDDSDDYLIGPDMRRDMTPGPLQVRIDIKEVIA